MAPRDYELEAAVAAVEGRVPDEIVRAIIVHAPGALDATLGGALRGLFGRAKREAGLRNRNVLVLTRRAIRLYACDANSHPPVVLEELGAWPVERVELATVTREKTSPYSVRGSITARLYRLALTVPDRDDPIELDAPRSDSARATILATEDATGSPPSKVTARRRAKRARPTQAGSGSEQPR